MTIQELVNEHLKNAILTNNTEAKSILRVLIGEFNRVDKIVSDEKATSIIKKMVENAKLLGNTNEVSILEYYLPKQLSESQLTQIVVNLVNEYSYTIKEMGKVMSYLKENFSGQYDGKLASEIIKKVLAS